MIKTGLVSVTFRQLTVNEVVKIAKETGLEGIEWGGDIHVPPGDVAAAEKARELTEKAGLSVFAYGSYFRPGECADAAEEFKPVLLSAVVLHAPIIRVWAGAQWTHEAEEEYYQKVVEDTRTICDMAAEKGIKVAYEYHGWSLTDTGENACKVFNRINKENMRLYWQPNFTLSHEENCRALHAVLPYVDYIHAFYWTPDAVKLPMAEGIHQWKEFVDILKADDKKHCIMMEFVKDDEPNQLLEDVKAFKEIL